MLICIQDILLLLSFFYRMDFFFYLHDMTASFVFSCSLQATWFTVLRTMTSLTTDGPPRSPVGHTWLWRTSNPTPGDSLNNSRHMFITHNLKVKKDLIGHMTLHPALGAAAWLWFCSVDICWGGLYNLLVITWMYRIYTVSERGCVTWCMYSMCLLVFMWGCVGIEDIKPGWH